MDFDYIVVGGGSAGCVLANRLSANPRRRVLLVEAGRDTPPDQVEPAILDSYPRIAYFNSANLWADLRVRLTPSPHNDPTIRSPLRRYEQARLMGGGSSLNDMHANRGTPDDYREWESLGATGWGWEDVLPFYRKLERDLDFEGPLHGDSGPLPIRRIFPDVWPGFSIATANAIRAAGYRELPDHNAEFGDGYFPIAITNINDRRVSTAMAYLTNTVRRRPNLSIMANTVLRRLIVGDGRVTGVELCRDEQRRILTAGEVVLAAGAIHSPAILLRAGIGPADELRAIGLDVVADRPGVGRNLSEHPTLTIAAYMKRDARLQRSLRRHIHLGLRYSSGLDAALPSDMHLLAICRTGWHPVGDVIGSLLTWVSKPFSRGTVRLVSADANDEPDVSFNLLADHRDATRLKNGLRFIARLYDHPAMKAAAEDPFPSAYSERIRELGRITAKNHVLTFILARMLDGPRVLRRFLIDNVITESASLSEMLADDDLLDAFVREQVHGDWHASCTCRIGGPDDREAVVDPSGRVYGVRGLRVADASVMPTVTRGNTNLPTIMIAEKISQAILSD